MYEFYGRLGHMVDYADSMHPMHSVNSFKKFNTIRWKENYVMELIFYLQQIVDHLQPWATFSRSCIPEE